MRRARMGYAVWGAPEARAAIRARIGFDNKAPESLKAKLVSAGYGNRIVLLNHASAALEIALRAMHAMKPDRRIVIVPAYCCPSVPKAIAAAGLIARAAPVDERLNLGIDSVPEIAGADTLAIVGVHMYGLKLDIGTLTGWASPRGIFVIDDSAHVLGDASFGTTGDIGLLSFNLSKTLTGGSPNGGGALLVRHQDLADAIDTVIADVPYRRSRLRHHIWFAANYAFDPLPLRLASYAPRLFNTLGRLCKTGDKEPALMGSGVAAIINAQMSRLDTIRERRRTIAGWYHESMGNDGRFHLVQYSPEAHLTRMICAWSDGPTSDQLRVHLNRIGISARAPYPAWSDDAKTLLGDRLQRHLELPGSINLRRGDVDTIVATLSEA